MTYFEFLNEHGVTLLLGTVTTIKVLVCSMTLYVIISMIFGLMRLSKNRAIQGIATVYIELITYRIMEQTRTFTVVTVPNKSVTPCSFKNSKYVKVFSFRF